MATFPLALKHAELDARNAERMGTVSRETGNRPIAPTGTAGGDTRTLRGIPALGRGVGGAINGSRPGGRT